MSNKLERYKTIADIFKGYLDTALTANIWFYAIAGAIVTNYLSERQAKPYLKFSLALPLILGVALGIISASGISKARKFKVSVLEVRKNEETNETPPADILIWFLRMTLGMSIIICVCLVSLFFWWPPFVYGS